MQDNYPGNQQLLIEALNRKLNALEHMINNSTQHELLEKLLEEEKETANKILLVIGEMKAEGSSEKFLFIEANAYNCLASLLPKKEQQRLQRKL